MRNLIIGIGIGIAAALTLGAATPGRYQVAAAVAPESGPYVFRLDTQTGTVEACRYFPRDIPVGVPIQVLQPR